MGGFGGFWGVLGGADNVLGCPPYKIFSWTCCYGIHSSLAPYPGTRYQLLLVTCKTLLIFALLFLWGWFFVFFWRGLITFLAARLTRYSLGLAATLSTLLLHCTLAHAINFFSSLARHSWFLHCCFFGGGVWGGADNVLGCPSSYLQHWHVYVLLSKRFFFQMKNVHSNWRHTKREMAITKWVKVCIQWSSNGCAVKQFCRVLPKNWCHALSICWRNIMTFNDGFIHWSK